MSSLSCKNVKIQDSSGNVVSTISYDGTNITIDKPVLAPTAAATTNNTQVATTAMVHSAITNDLHVTGSAPMYACRAWVNFDGTQSSPTIRGSGNISSIGKATTGQYTINFTTAMQDINYCAVGGQSVNNNSGYIALTIYSTSSIAMLVASNGAYVDPSFTTVSIFR
jgi:hypothetical protein